MIPTPDAAQRATLTPVDGGFDLHVDNRLILSHRAAHPCLSLEEGHAEIAMYRGNFRLTDTPARTLRPLHVRLGTHTVTFSATPEGPALARLTLNAPAAPAPVRLHLTTLAPGFNRLALSLHAEPQEHVWGGGEQMSYFNLRGRAFPIWTSEPGVGRDKSTEITRIMDETGMAGGDYWNTNYPQPTFLSQRLYAAHLTSTAYSVLDFTAPDAHTITVWEPEAAVEIHTAPDLSRLVQAMAARFGRQPPLPDWILSGAIVGLKDGQNSLTRLDAILDAGAAVCGLWCEDWVGIRQTSFGRRLFWDWRWNPARYPDLPASIASLRTRGIRFLGYVNPYIAADAQLYPEALAGGHLARRTDSDAVALIDFGEFDCAVVDFTRPETRDWFAERVIGREMLDFGLSGWMADFGEYLPVDIRLADGSDPWLRHNEWPVLWAQVNAQAVASRGATGEAVFFMRAGFSGVQAHCPLLWAGDQSVDFTRHDGIGTVITAALSAGVLGNAFSHSDVGGYTSVLGNVRTPELLMRWCELGAFTPVMRTHEGNRPTENLQIDSSRDILAHFAAFTRVHRALFPYVRAMVDEAAATGLPVQRPLWLDPACDPQNDPDNAGLDIQDQYLYGADLVVAPVIEAGATARSVVLPAGADWVHVWTGQVFAPGRHQVAAPLGAPPVFWRKGSRWADVFEGLRAARDGAEGTG